MQSPNEFFKCSGRKKQGFAKVFCRLRRREERGDEDAGHPHPAGDWPSPAPLLLKTFAKPCRKKERHTNVALFFAYSHTSIFSGWCFPGETECPGWRGRRIDAWRSSRRGICPRRAGWRGTG